MLHLLQALWVETIVHLAESYQKFILFSFQLCLITPRSLESGKITAEISVVSMGASKNKRLVTGVSMTTREFFSGQKDVQVTPSNVPEIGLHDDSSVNGETYAWEILFSCWVIFEENPCQSNIFSIVFYIRNAQSE